MLKNVQSQHKKAKHIQHKSLKVPQQYLCNPKFNFKLSSLLFNLRCESVKDIKANFHTMYSDDDICPLCLNDRDTQQHLLKCPILISNLSVKEKEKLKSVQYSHIYSDINEQYCVTKIFQSILKIREKLLAAGSLPGPHTGPNN